MLKTGSEVYKVPEIERKFYERYGYVRLPGVWPKEDIDILRRDIDYQAQGKFTVRIDLHHNGATKEMHRCKKMCTIGDSILGGKAIPIGSTTFYCKPNNNLEHGSIWHQDNFAPMCPNGNNYLNLAVVLDDADETNGSLIVVPGSHKLGMIPFTPKPNFTIDEDGNQIQGAPIGDVHELSEYGIEGMEEEQLEYKSGDVLVVNGLLVHKANKNQHPTRWRRTIYSVYIKELEPFWPGWTAKRRLLERYDHKGT